MKIKEIWKMKGEIEALFSNNSPVSIYGAGKYAIVLIKFILELNLNPECIYVTNKTKETGYIQEIQILQFDSGHHDGAVIIAAHSKYHEEILSIINGKFDTVFILPDSFFENLYQINSIEYRSDEGVWTKCPSITSMIEKLSLSMTIVVQRFGGIGDVLSLEPLCRALKNVGFYVGIATHYTELFSYNDSADFRLNMMFSDFIMDNAIFVCLDNMYESRPFHHIFDAYLDVVKQFFFDIQLDNVDRIPVYDKSLIQAHNGEIRSICINIEASEWKSRIFNKDRMAMFVKYLISKQYKVYEIGNNPKNYLGIGEYCFGLNLHETVTLMSKTDLYIGLDNGLMHLAQSIRLPVFILFGCTCPNFRIYDWSRARVMWKNVDELPCAACYHRRMIPCREPQCHWETVRCLDWSVEEVIEAFENEKYDNPPKLLKEMYEPIWWNEMT